ncbi:S6 family peptidase [Volucribacter amazonae]|nr:S6 family peptidase [Volucribacter amazonae]
MIDLSSYLVKKGFVLSKLNQLLLPVLFSTLSVKSHASIVRGDIDYQYFRDFAENKGQFTVGAMNVPIYNKSGQNIGTMLRNVPMVDFSVINSDGGFTTLIDPQYLVSVSHNGYNKVQFGSIENHPDSHTFTYQLVHHNNYVQDQNNPYHKDYHTPRLHKLVTEVMPVETVTNVHGASYNNSHRYPLVVRAGSGTQQVRENNQNKWVAGAYHFLTGSAVTVPYTTSYAGFGTHGSVMGNHYGPMVNIALAGDSGSGVFVYDAQEQKWKLMAVTFASLSGATGNIYWVVRSTYNKRIKDANIGTIINNSLSDTQWTWRHTATVGTHQVSSGSHSHDIAVFNPNLTGRNRQTNPQLNHGKTVIFTGEAGRLHFAGNVNQGAGALFFDTDYKVTGENGITWQGAGISIAQDKTLIWQIANPKGDRLSKIGAGTLHINGTGKNEGDISIGDGIVILDQQADSNGEKQAFNRLGIVSGRPTVRLTSADQMDWNNLYFGFRGGRLDLNGNHIHMQRIKHVDDGAHIVNHNLNQSASLTLTGQPEFTEAHIQWGQWGIAGADLYEYINNHKGNRKDYFILKGNANAWFPTEQNSDSNWEFLGSGEQGKNQAIAEIITRKNLARKHTALNGTLGENNPALNGELHLTYTPNLNGSSLLLTGNIHLNGNLTTNGNSTLYLSGRPTPHAYDHLNKKEVIKDHDWITRQIRAKHIIANDHSQIHIGRNISQLNSNITARDHARIELGYTNNHSPVCHRSDYTGNINCTTPNYHSDITNHIARLQYQGNINLNDNAQLYIGKTDLHSAIQGDTNSQITLGSESHWTLTQNSTIGHLNMQNGAQLTLSQTNNNFHTLHIQGNLSGNGQINYRTDLGNMQSDSIHISGSSEGNFTLMINNSGKEPQKSKDRLTLLTITPEQQNGKTLNIRLANPNEHIDIGAYRYQLINETNAYRLYNPIVEAQIQEQERQQAEEARKKAEAERQRLEEEKRKQAEEARRQAEEQARQQAEAERQRQAEEQAHQQAEVERQRQAEQARQQAEAERQRQAEEQARQQAEAERQRQAEEQARQQAEAERQRQEEQALQQAQTISRYTNTALSEQTSYVHTLGRLNHSVFMQINQDNDNFFITNHYQQSHHQSNEHRHYRKNQHQIQTGASHSLTNPWGKLSTGIIYTYAKATHNFDDHINGKNQTHQLTLYAKQTLTNQLHIAINAGQTHSRSNIQLEGQHPIKHRAHTIGISIGKQITTSWLNATAALGINHNHLSASQYPLAGADIKTSSENLVSYHAQLTLEKPLTLSPMTLTPYLSADHIKYHKNSQLSVNQHHFTQTFSDYTNIGTGIRLKTQNWQTHLQINYGKGKNIDSTRSVQFGLRYAWK